MKYILALLLFSCQLGFAQDFFYPKLNKQVTNLAALTPTKWKVIDTAFGDLNSDKREDMAVILEYNLPITEHRAYGNNEIELIKEFQKPRILAIYFKEAKTNRYVFALQNNNFILRENEGGEAGEPLKKLKIENNILNLAFEGGGMWRWKLNYQFKYQQNNFSLVKANNTYYNPSSGELTDKDYNFLERKITRTYGNLFSREAANIVNEEILYYTQLKTLSTFKKPWTWEITKDNFL